MFRRSRVVVAAAFLMVLILLSIINYDINLLSLEKIQPLINGISGYDFYEKVLSRFETKFLIPSRNLQLNADDEKKLYLMNLMNDEKNNEIKIPEIYYQQDGTHEANPKLINFDPRLSFGLLLDSLNYQLNYGSDLNNFELSTFHWADWMDLSVLNQYFFKREKASCQQVFDVSTGNKQKDKKFEILEPPFFCIDDEDIDKKIEELGPNDPFVKELLAIKEDRHSTGFHVFKYGGRSKIDLKVLQSKSYLNDFMPPPLSITVLLPRELEKHENPKKIGSNTIRVNIKQDQAIKKERIVNSNLFKDYCNKFIKYNDLSTTRDVTINAKDQLDTFMRKISHLLTKEEPIHYEKHLTHDQFIDNSTKIMNALLSKENLSPHEVSYKNGLDMSLHSPYPPKYFFEAKLLRQEPNWELGGHYDWRFFNGIINYTEDQPSILFGLLRSWFALINSYDFNSWIAHGTLLSWYWNGMTFPWDIDYDVQMPIQDLHNLCRNFNQSLIFDMGNEKNYELRYGRFLLDCGSYLSHRKYENGNNNIDARYIDIDTGLYIDITGLTLTDTKAPKRYDSLLPEPLNRLKVNDEKVNDFTRNEYLKIYNCRNNHFQSIDDLSPLKLTYFEGQTNYIPNGYKDLLIHEYGQKSILLKKFKLFSFMDKIQLWDATKTLINFVKTKYPEKSQQMRKYRASNVIEVNAPNFDKVITQEFETDQDYLQYLFDNKNLLIEYLITHDMTEFHRQEMELLNNGKSSKSLLMTANNELKHYFPPARHDSFNFKSFKNDYDFNKVNEGLLKQFNNFQHPEEQIEQVEGLQKRVESQGSKIMMDI